MAFIAPFLAENYHVVAYDLTGMGDSGVRDAYPDSIRAQEVVDVAQKTGLFDHAQKPIVIAHSYGGHVGLTAMNEHHALFGGLIICDLMVLRLERLKAHFAGGRPLRSDPNRPNRVYPDYAAAKSRFVLSPNQPCGEPYLFDYMAFHSLKEVEGGWTWKFDTSVFDSDFSVRDRILHQAEAVVAAPGRKAYIYGQESLLFDDDSADYVREMGGTDIPFIGVPGARHHLMLDEPIAFVSTLRSVLALWSASEEPEAAK
jgi:pimeloyl-ACP methyl ester carboxylesterase